MGQETDQADPKALQMRHCSEAVAVRERQREEAQLQGVQPAQHSREHREEVGELHCLPRATQIQATQLRQGLQLSHFSDIHLQRKIC